MSSPLELIRSGIQTGSWESVCNGFKALTGETIEAPTSGSTDLSGLAEEVSKLILSYSSAPIVKAKTKKKVTKPKAEPKPEPEPEPEEEPAAKPREDGERRVARRQNHVAGKNKFVDDGSYCPEFLDESKALSVKKKPEPRRSKIRLVHVKCGKCGKEEDVEPIFAPRSFDSGDERASYVCNRCIRK